MVNYRQVKAARYREYEELLERALAAGEKAMQRVPARPVPRRGAAWVSLRDARSSFGRFLAEAGYLLESGDGRWKRGNRQQGTYLPAEVADFDQALAWADAVEAVLSRGEVEVTVGFRPITTPEASQ